DLLDLPDKEILVNFVKAYYLLVYQIIDNILLIEAYVQLLYVEHLIKENY
ncbi:5353_t:CDS:1, partial [Funneliformis geosporum]